MAITIENICERHYITASQYLLLFLSTSVLVTIIEQNSAVEHNLKNIKFIESKYMPDVNLLLNDSKINQHDENWQQIYRFMIHGFPILQLHGYKILKDIPFTLIIPNVDIRIIEKSSLKEFMLEHIIPGHVFNTFIDDKTNIYGNGNGHKIIFRKLETSSKKTDIDIHSDIENDTFWLLNGFQILSTTPINEKLIAISINGYLGDRKSPYAKRNIQDGNNRFNEPQHLEMRNTTGNVVAHTKIEPILKESKMSPLMSFLSNMKIGTKVFQHFLLKSNLTHIMDNGTYIILIPNDNAFQRWHPIDWGFYPFSVQEFTENILRNHFLPSEKPLGLNDIKMTDHMIKRTLGGEYIVFRGHPTPSVNNVSILSEYQLSNGNKVFLISEVLFVSEAVVSKLHQMNKDKETPPLLAFPWFGAQFLSHSFLALERDPRFTEITRYLNNAEIAPHVSGANYTFFVPNDKAFEKLGFDKLSDEILSSSRGVKMLLNHFVKGRLYNRDLHDNEIFETLGGGQIKITCNPGSNVTNVNNAKIIESEIFVYNLGTMFFIDDILYSQLLHEYIVKNKIRSNKLNVTRTTTSGTPVDVEIVPNIKQNNDEYSIHDDEFEDEIITPKALPVHFYQTPK